MKSNPFALAIAGLLLASCGGESANEAASSTETAAATEPAAAAPTAAAPAAVQGEQAAYGPGELLPGGAIDVLQREGWPTPPA